MKHLQPFPEVNLNEQATNEIGSGPAAPGQIHPVRRGSFFLLGRAGIGKTPLNAGFSPWHSGC
jgi:hypothetical protein